MTHALAKALAQDVRFWLEAGRIAYAAPPDWPEAERASIDRAHLARLLDAGLDLASPDWRDLFEERAAILEFDQGLDRQSAEAAALAEVTTALERAYDQRSERPRRSVRAA